MFLARPLAHVFELELVSVHSSRDSTRLPTSDVVLVKGLRVLSECFLVSVRVCVCVSPDLWVCQDFALLWHAN